MVTQTVEGYAPTVAGSVTAKLFARGSDTVVASVAASAATNRKGVWTAAFTDIPAGCYRIGFFTNYATDAASWMFVDLLLQTGTYEALEVPTSLMADAIGDYMEATAQAELTAIPGTSPSIVAMLKLLYQLAKHRLTQTDAVLTAYKADGTTALGTSAVSDDGTTFDRGALS